MIRFFAASMLMVAVVSILGQVIGLNFWERLPLNVMTVAALACIFWDDIPTEKK